MAVSWVVVCSEGGAGCLREVRRLEDYTVVPKAGGDLVRSRKWRPVCIPCYRRLKRGVEHGTG